MKRDRNWKEQRAPLRELAAAASTAVCGEPHAWNDEAFVCMDGRLTVEVRERGEAHVEGILLMTEVVAMITHAAPRGDAPNV